MFQATLNLYAYFINHCLAVLCTFLVMFGNFGKETLRKIWNIEDLMVLENWNVKWRISRRIPNGPPTNLVVFPTHFSPNNSLLISLQISLLFRCTSALTSNPPYFTWAESNGNEIEQSRDSELGLRLDKHNSISLMKKTFFRKTTNTLFPSCYANEGLNCTYVFYMADT